MFVRLQELLANYIFRKGLQEQGVSMDVEEMIHHSIDRLTVKTDLKKVEVERKSFPGARAKECYNNTFKYIAENGGTFVLGYLVYAKAIPIEHAWVRDGDKYFDVTLKDNKGDEYYSVMELNFDDVMEYVDKYSTAPDIYSWERFKRSSGR